MTDQVKYVIGDREVVFNRPTDGQIAALIKLVEGIRKANSAQANSQVMRLFARLLGIFDALMADPEDVEHVEDMMISGKLDLMELMNVIKQFSEDEEAPTTGPKPRARRART